MPQTECNHCQESKSIEQAIKDLDQRIKDENSEIKNSLHFDKKSSAKIRKKCEQIIKLLQRERERERERERAKLLQLKSSCSCSEISWQDTPTPSDDKHFDFPPKGSETSSSEIPVQINKETQTTLEIDYQSFREQATKNFINFSQIWNKGQAESQQKDQLFWINLVNKNHQKFLDYQQQTNQQINNLENAYQDLQTELEDQDQIIENKNLNIIELVKKLNRVKNEAKKHKAKRKEVENQLANYKNSRFYWKNKSQESQKKSKKRWKNYQKTQEKLKQEQSKYYLTKLERDHYKNQLDTHTCSCSHNDYETLKTQLANKDQKIRELEQIIKELRTKPPANPVNQEPKPNESKNETNNFLLEKEQLLSTIRQQKNTIQELQTKLKNANEKEPMVVEVPKVDLIAIQRLKNEVKIRDRAIILLLIVSGVIVILLMLNTTRLLTNKSRKK